MLLRAIMTATVAGLLMIGMAWAPPADAWGRSGYYFGRPLPPFSPVAPFGSPYYPPPFVVPRSPWITTPRGYPFYGYRPYSPGFYPGVSPYPYGGRPWYRHHHYHHR